MWREELKWLIVKRILVNIPTVVLSQDEGKDPRPGEAGDGQGIQVHCQLKGYF